jgi:cholest-4-en-3-one 26-monooxygenase
MVSLRQIDLLDRDEFGRRVPHEWFEHLRRSAPIYRHPEPDGPGFWVLTRYEDVAELTRNWTSFSSDQERGGVVGLEDRRQAEEGGLDRGGQMMLTMDPPAHTRYRKLVNRAFTPRSIRRLEERLRAASGEIVERAMAADGGRCDFVTDVAAELPLLAIAELLGVPAEDRHQIFHWSNRLVGIDDPEFVADGDDVTEAGVEMFRYADGLARDRRRTPRDDMISKLVHGEVDGESLSEMDFNLFFLLLAVAGNETTRNAIASGMAALMDRPDQYELLAASPEIMATTGCEEVLRWATPVMYFKRNVTHDLDYKGVGLTEGEKVSIWFISANRDEDVFDDPYRFDLRREDNAHLAFGGGGPHHCLGAHLARLELRVLFEELVRRVERVEPAGEPERLRSNFVNGLKHLPVRLIAR